MKGFINTVNGWSFIVKLLLCIPLLDIFYSVCRIINSIAKGNILWIVASIILFFCAPFIWIVDIIWIIINGHAFMLG